MSDTHLQKPDEVEQPISYEAALAEKEIFLRELIEIVKVEKIARWEKAVAALETEIARLEKANEK